VREKATETMSTHQAKEQITLAIAIILLLGGCSYLYVPQKQMQGRISYGENGEWKAVPK